MHRNVTLSKFFPHVYVEKYEVARIYPGDFKIKKSKELSDIVATWFYWVVGSSFLEKLPIC